MIESVLALIFPIEYGINPASIQVPIVRHNAPFSVSDTKACEPCQANPQRAYRAGCNHEILKVNNNGEEIAIVSYERYIAQYDQRGKDMGERCDLLMTNSGMEQKKIVFCDLCCYSEKYVEPNTGRYPQGKRAKARQQMERSIDVLINKHNTSAFLLTYHEKICLFAWRDYNVPDVPVMATRGNARSNVQAFGSTISNMATTTTTHHQKVGHDFTFMQVKYPTAYNW